MQFVSSAKALPLAALMAGAVLAQTPASAEGPVPGIVAQDLAARSADVHWPKGFAPGGGGLFAHNEIRIDASCATVWSLLVDARRWPAWYANAHNVRLTGKTNGQLGPGSRFEWDTFGTHIVSKVAEFSKDERLGWYGWGPGIEAYHSWRLIAGGGSCTVLTEEVKRDVGATQDHGGDPTALHKAHALWLEGLKQSAERR